MHWHSEPVCVLFWLFSGARLVFVAVHSKTRCRVLLVGPEHSKTLLLLLLLQTKFPHRAPHKHIFCCCCFFSHRPAVLIRMTKRKMARIDSHSPLWAALAHFNSVLMRHVSIKAMIMWQRRPGGQIASNRPAVMLSRWRLQFNACVVFCVWCAFRVRAQGLDICAKYKRSFCSCQKNHRRF